MHQKKYQPNLEGVGTGAKVQFLLEDGLKDTTVEVADNERRQVLAPRLRTDGHHPGVVHRPEGSVVAGVTERHQVRALGHLRGGGGCSPMNYYLIF